MAIKQWVNLDSLRSNSWTAITAGEKDPIADNDHIGRAVFATMTFDKDIPTTATFVLRKISGEDYSASEQSRNPASFKAHDPSTDGPGADGKEVELYGTCTAAGGAQYRFEAIDAEGKEVQSSETIEAWRRLYIFSLKMDSSRVATDAAGAPGVIDPGSTIADIETAYLKYFVRWIHKAEAPMTHATTIEDTSWSRFHGRLQGAVNRAPWKPDFELLKPWSTVLCFVDTVHEREEVSQIFEGQDFVDFGDVKYFPTDQAVYVNVGSYLWEMNDEEVRRKVWLKARPEFQFLDSLDEVRHQRTTIHVPNKYVTTAYERERTYGGHKWIKIDLSADDMTGVQQRLMSYLGSSTSTPKTTVVMLKLKVGVVKGSACGYSLSNLCVIADKVYFEKADQPKRNVVVMHELGHYVGMAAAGGAPGGDNRNPDAVAHLYGNTKATANGHQGPHCGNGMTYTGNKWQPAASNWGARRNPTSGELEMWQGGPKCVMFGQVSYSKVLNPTDFCGACAPAVKKLDLSEAGLRPLTKSGAPAPYFMD